MSGDGADDRALERRYRSLLRLLPKRYREARGEEMITAYLDAAADRGETGRARGWPDPREVLSLAALAVRVRTGTGTGVRVARIAELARLIALCGAFWLAVDGIGTAVAGYRVWGGIVWPITKWLQGDHPNRGYLALVRFEIQGLWFPVYAALAAGLRRTGGLLAAGLCVVVVMTTVNVVEVRELPLMVVIAVACFVPAKRSGLRRHRGWLAATAVPLVIGGYWFFLAPVPSNPLFHPELGMSWLPTAVVITVATAVCVRNRHSVTWLAAVAVAGMQPLLLGGGAVLLGTWSPSWSFDAITVFEVCLVAALGVAVVRDRRRDHDGERASPA